MNAAKINLDGLDVAQLTQLVDQARARAAILGGDKAKSDSDPSEGAKVDERLIYDACAEAMRPHLGVIPPHGVFAKAHNKAKAFTEGAALMVQYVDDYMQPKGRAQRVKAFRYLCTLLVRSRLRKVKLYPNATPLSIFSFIADMAQLGVIVENQFPGYVESNLLGIILKKNAAKLQVA